MAYHVTWYVFGPDERLLDRDAFPDRFESREAAIAFVLEKLSAFSDLGYDRARGFWGRGPHVQSLGCETRFVVSELARPRASQRR